VPFRATGYSSIHRDKKYTGSVREKGPYNNLMHPDFPLWSDAAELNVYRLRIGITRNQLNDQIPFDKNKKYT
jgi:hypothetical protein